jgi:hypothetical protein
LAKLWAHTYLCLSIFIRYQYSRTLPVYEVNGGVRG